MLGIAILSCVGGDAATLLAGACHLSGEWKTQLCCIGLREALGSHVGWAGSPAHLHTGATGKATQAQQRAILI